MDPKQNPFLATQAPEAPLGGDQQLFRATMLPIWLAAVLSTGDRCVAFLCGPPCSGKSEATRKMISHFGDLLCVVSNDLHCDGKTQQGCSAAEDVELVLRTITDKPRVIVCDDGNTQFHKFAGILTTAITMGVKLENFGWFVFDGGLPEDEEVELLSNLQQKRLKEFWKGTTEHLPFNASDGKVTTPDTIRQAVRETRMQFFANGTELRLWNTETIISELMEFARVQYRATPAPSYPMDPIAKFSSAMVPALPNGAVHPNNNHGAPSVLTGGLDAFALDDAGSHTLTAGPMGPCIGLPTDTNGISKGFQDAFASSGAEQLLGPMYFVLTDGQNGSQVTPLQMPLNSTWKTLSSNSSAASPPFTSTNPVMHNGDVTETNVPADKLSFTPDDAPGSREALNNFFSVFSSPHSVSQTAMAGSPGSPGPTIQLPGDGNTFSQAAKPPKPEKKEKPRKEPKKNGNGVAGKNSSKASNLSKGMDMVMKNGKNSRKPKVPAGWGDAAGQNCAGATPNSKEGMTLRSVLNEYWKAHKGQMVNELDIKVPAGLLSKSASAAIEEMEDYEDLSVEDAMQPVASPVC